MARVTKTPEERKSEILDTAEQLFKEKGYEQTSVSEIVKRVGVAQGTFYYHFKSKEEIADSVIDRSLARLIEPVQLIAAKSELSALDKLTHMIQIDYQKRLEHNGAFDYLHHEKNSTLHQKMIVKLILRYSPILTEVIEQGVKEGMFHTKHPKEIADFFLTGFQFLFDPGIFNWSEEEMHMKLQASNEIIEKLLGAPKDSFKLF